MEPYLKPVAIVSAVLIILAGVYVVELRGEARSREDSVDTVAHDGEDHEENGSSRESEHFEDTGTLSFGLAGMGDTASFAFSVNEGAVEVVVVCDGSNGTFGGGDIDLEVWNPAGDRHKSSAAPGSFEKVVLDNHDIKKRFGYGDYEARLICYSGAGLDYTLRCDVYYSGNATGEGEGAGALGDGNATTYENGAGP